MLSVEKAAQIEAKKQRIYAWAKKQFDMLEARGIHSKQYGANWPLSIAAKATIAVEAAEVSILLTPPKPPSIYEDEDEEGWR